MDAKDRKEQEELRKEIREEEKRDIARDTANSLKADGKENHNRSTKRINKLWIWLGVLILIFLLIWWIWTIGTAEDISGITNG